MADYTNGMSANGPENVTVGPAGTAHYDRPTDSMLQTIQSKEGCMGAEVPERMQGEGHNESAGSVAEDGSL